MSIAFAPPPSSRVRSSKAGELRDAVAAVTPHEVTPIGTQLDGLVQVLPLNQSQLVFVRYGGDVLVEAPATQSRVVATVPLGPMEVTTGASSASRSMSSGFLLDTQERTLMRPDAWAGALVLAADATTVAEHEHVVLGSEGTRYRNAEISPLLTSACKRAWAASSAIDADTPLDVAGLLIASLERELLTALVLSWNPGEVRGEVACRARIAELRAWLEDNHGIEVTAADMARHAGLSLRQLQASLHAELGLTPTGLLRRVRMDHARRMLRELDSTQTTVARIAHTAGFAHLGRFSAQYFEEFGELPSASLRR